jgi:large conductance mechanosensitive channel
MIKETIKDFKEFAFKGNLVDMAVGIIIGGAFGTVVKSLVDDVFMPVIGYLTGGVDFSDKVLVLGEVPEGSTAKAAAEAGEVVLLTYGNFVTSFISFIILAFVLFLVIQKFMAALKKKEEAPAPAAPAEDILLLTEIRDLLKEQKS